MTFGRIYLVGRFFRSIDQDLPFEDVGVGNERDVHALNGVLFEVGEFLESSERTLCNREGRQSLTLARRFWAAMVLWFGAAEVNFGSGWWACWRVCFGDCASCLVDSCYVGRRQKGDGSRISSTLSSLKGRVTGIVTKAWVRKGNAIQ